MDDKILSFLKNRVDIIIGKKIESLNIGTRFMENFTEDERYTIDDQSLCWTIHKNSQRILPLFFLSSHVFAVFVSESHRFQKIKEREVITPATNNSLPR